MASTVLLSAAPPPAVDAAFEKFWSAHNPQDAAKAAQTIVGSPVSRIITPPCSWKRTCYLRAGS